MIKSVNNQDFKIIAVSNRKLCNRPFLEQIERVCKIHPEAVILREKDLTEEEYGTLAKEVMNICSRYQVSCILHNFWKTALETGMYIMYICHFRFCKKQLMKKRKIYKDWNFYTFCRRSERSRAIGSFLSYGRAYLCDRL